jgi:flagellar biosynthesis/type III secretory pathway protein FliH
MNLFKLLKKKSFVKWYNNEKRSWFAMWTKINKEAVQYHLDELIIQLQKEQASQDTVKKFFNLFKWRLRLVQQGYNLGWQHGYKAGMDENQKQIVDKVNKLIHDVDWLKEDPYTRKEIVEAIKEHVPDKEIVGWD